MPGTPRKPRRRRGRFTVVTDSSAAATNTPSAQSGVRGAPNGSNRNTVPGGFDAAPDGSTDTTAGGRAASSGTGGGGLGAVEVAGLMHELSARLLSSDHLPQALDRLAAFAAGVVPGVVRCSVVLIAEGGPLTRASSGSAGQGVDDRQFESGEGPGLDAARTRALVTAQDLPTDPRWPTLSTAAREEAVHSVVAIPLDVQRSSVGSVSFFLDRPHGADPDLLLTAMAIVSQTEILLGELRRRELLAEGATVDRAAGVIIAQRGCGVQAAYRVLQETAQRLGLDRVTVAERLITAAARHATP